MINPILLLRCEIWGPYLFGKINNFKNKFFKTINEIEEIHFKIL